MVRLCFITMALNAEEQNCYRDRNREHIEKKENKKRFIMSNYSFQDKIKIFIAVVVVVVRGK